MKDNNKRLMIVVVVLLLIVGVLPTDSFELDQINRGQKGNKEATRVL